MKLLRFALILVFSIQFTACREASVPPEIKEGIDSIASRWIPVPEEGVGTFSLETVSGKTPLLRGETNLPGAKKEIKDYLEKSGISFIDSLVVLPDTNVVKKPWGLVTLSVCNMRIGPSHDAELVSQAIMGTPVMVLKKEDGWLFIQTPDSYVGWTNDDAIAELTTTGMNNWRGSERVIYTSNYGNITDGQGGVVSDLVYGALLAKTGESAKDYEVLLPDGRRGYISKTSARDFSSWAKHGDPVADELVSFARTLLGSPYLWGGTSTKGIDCSGFARTIYFTNGVILTRDASSQYMYGTEIPVENWREALAPGDLLFFGRIRDGRKRITHVGMYIGDTEVIHSSGMVKINSLDPERGNYSEYLGSTLLGAKRFIGAPSGRGNMRVLLHTWYF